jgi:hypothetical protein
VSAVFLGERRQGKTGPCSCHLRLPHHQAAAASAVRVRSFLTSHRKVRKKKKRKKEKQKKKERNKRKEKTEQGRSRRWISI